MKKINLDAHEYRTPVCKVVLVLVEGIVCSSIESAEENEYGEY